MRGENSLAYGPPLSLRPRKGMTCSVVIPCWNSESSIAAAIESVINQEGLEVDCIVVDDGSTDGSLAIVRSYGRRIRWLAQANLGACVARNKGAAMSTADHVLFLDSDDYLMPGVLAALCERAREAGSDMVVAARRRSDGAQTRLEGPGAWSDAAELTLDILKRGECPQTATVLWRRSFLRRVGGWNESVLQGQDVEIMLRALCARPRIAKSDTVSIVYDDTDNPRRMAFRRGEAYDLSHLDYLSAIEKDLLRLTGDIGRRALARHYYGVARHAYRQGWVHPGRRALKMARGLGLRNHPGSFMHQTLCGVIGLWLKERLAAHLSSRSSSSLVPH